MNATSVDIAEILEDNSIGTIGTDLFVSLMPDSPDQCIGVFDTGGVAPQANDIYQPTVQIRVRGDIGDYRGGHLLAENIKNLLHNLHGESWGVSWYIGVWAMSDIFHVGVDEKNRPLFSVNFRILRT